MRKILILLLFFPILSSSQIPTGRWKTVTIGKDSVQQSQDQIKWTNLTNGIILKADSSIMDLPLVTAWYRMKSGTYTSKALKLTITVPPIIDSAKITNPVLKQSSWQDKLTWTTQGESNVLHYLIEKIVFNNFVTVKKVLPKGNSNYTLTVSRFGGKPTYRITTIFKDGKLSSPLNFK